MNIMDLPNEMLAKVASLLPVDDLKSLSLTCNRFNELVKGPVMVKKAVLWLNKTEESLSSYGNTTVKMRFISVEALQACMREYNAFGINLTSTMLKSELITLQSLLNVLVWSKWTVRELYVVDSKLLHIVTLCNHFSTLFQKLEGLSVTVRDAPLRDNLLVDWKMPNLRWIKWNELKYHSQAWETRFVRIRIHAPKLENVHIVLPKDLYVENDDYHSILELSYTDQLRELECFLGFQAVNLLSFHQLPALKRLCLYKEEYDTRVCWDKIASNVPNLQKLEIRRNPHMLFYVSPLRSFLVHCSILTELHLEGVNISGLITAPCLWNGIETLHLHNCTVHIPEHSKLILTLPNVRKLCLSIGLDRLGDFLLNLPKVEVLSLTKANESFDIVDMPMIHTLHLRISLQHKMTFLTRWLPQLRNLILNTPATFLTASGQHYRLLLGPMIQLTNLTVVCRSGHAINDLLEQIHRDQPALRAVQLIGDGVVSKISKNTLRSLMSLSRLESLLMTNIQITGTLVQPLSLPRTLRQLRVRSLCTPLGSRFISVKGTQQRLGKIEDRRVLQHQFININASEIPNLDVVRGSAERCIDQLTSLFPNA